MDDGAPPTPALLGPELLGRALEGLPLADLRAARLAARIFDEASREHTSRTASVTLIAGRFLRKYGPVPNPSWARFPRLRHLKLAGWDPDHYQLLRLVLAGGGDEPLAGVEEVTVRCTPRGAPDAPTWAAILARAPRVAALRLVDSGYRDNDADGSAAADAALTALATAAALAPYVKRLDASEWPIGPASAALISANMPSLTSLVCKSPWGGKNRKDAPTSADEAALWAALPCMRLTELRVSDDNWYARPRSPMGPPQTDRLPWPRMCVLELIRLPATHVVALARGLPGLQRLDAHPEGDWEGLDLPPGSRRRLWPPHEPQGVAGRQQRLRELLPRGAAAEALPRGRVPGVG